MSNYRNILKLANSGGYLRTEDHVYVLPDGTEFDLSVTGVVEHHFPFDKKDVSKRLSRYVPAYQGMTPKEIRKMWKEYRDHGSRVHDQISMYIALDIMPSEGKAKSAVKWYNDHMLASHESFPEITVYDRDTGLAGRIDLLVVNKETDQCDIMDWKTARNMSGGNRALTDECKGLSGKLDEYSLQLSFYACLLEMHGINVKRQIIIHLTEDGATEIEAEPYKHIVQEIIQNRSW